MSDDAIRSPDLAPRRERLAECLLGRYLAVVVGLLCLWELATWAPNYLTWPMYADHDVFATAATSWEAGIAPYRDFSGNNFPGTIYLFWLFGKVFGFGWALGPCIYGFDALLVMALGLALVLWSRAGFGRLLPGLVGYGGFLGYYLALDYSQAAQRDWQGPAFAMLGLLAVQTGGGGRLSRSLAAVLSAVGLIIRPQAILLMPAQAWSVFGEARSRGRSGVLAVIEWGAILSLALAALFLPLILNGLFDDFRQSLKVVAYGGKYNLVTPAMFFGQFLYQLQPLRVDIVPLGLLFLAPAASQRTRSILMPWVIALLGVLLYRPMSPHPHAYLTHPLMIVWSGLSAILVQMILERTALPASVRVVAVLLVMGLGLTAKPPFCNPNGSLEAPSVLRTHREPGPKPTGYVRHRDVPAAAHYEWKDYWELLDYLRKNTSKTTKIANCLKWVPAITGPTARLSAFPAESIAWVIVVREDDVPLFVERLEKSEDCVVVWSPSEKSGPEAPQVRPIFEAIERNFRPEAKFGEIEVWVRKAKEAP